MLENGRYSAWFKTPRAQGTGIVFLENGKITGEDTVIAYSTATILLLWFEPGGTAKVNPRYLASTRLN